MKIHAVSFFFPFPFGATDIFLRIGDVLDDFVDVVAFPFSTCEWKDRDD
jgi:hypothetical protein